MFKIAHLTDPHLAPLPWPSLLELAGKRATGFLSWQLKRRDIHLRSVLDTVTADIRRHEPDHVALTGDLVNISLPAEFIQARDWLGSFGPGEWITLAPGNHDAYVKIPWDSGPGLWREYFTSELRTEPTQEDSFDGAFPLVRFRRNAAVIAVSTARPTTAGIATGWLGASQLERLRTILSDLRQRGFYRMLLIHHPPLRNLAPIRKELTDGDRLRALLEAEGCELVVYGHNHLHQRADMASRHGPVHMIGLPSASQIEHHGCTAAWNLFDVKRQSGTWTTDVTTRSFDTGSRTMKTSAVYRLDHA